MYIIQTYNKVAEEGLRGFDREKYTIVEETTRPDAILVHSTPLHNIPLGPELKAICRIGAGTNTIPVEKCTQQGIVVFNTPGGNANAVKELTLAAMILCMRNVLAANAWVRTLKDGESDPGKAVEAGKEVYRGPELMGKTIGIIGVGAIGSRMARACHDLGMKVMGYDPYLGHARVKELKHYVQFVQDVNELYAASDIVSVHIPLTEANRGFVSRQAIAAMKDGVYLINYARGPVLDNDAVCDAIDSGKIRGFATDFPTARELGYPQALCTPHLGAGTPEADENCSVMAARQICEYLENGNITHSVNFPDVSFARAEGDRIAIMHYNRVGMLGRITEVVAAAGLNIENLVNKARGEIAYTILDFNEEVSSTVIEALTALDNVIRVRQIK